MKLLSVTLLLACKELVEDAKVECSDLTFKDVCLDILARARLALDSEEFEELSSFVADLMKDTIKSNSGRKIKIQ